MRHLEVLHPWAFGLVAVLLPVVLWAAVTSFDPVRRTRKVLVIVARVLIVIAVVVALASVRWWRRVPEEKLCVLALLDVSRSVPAGAVDGAVSQIEQLFAGADDAHAVGLVLFAGGANVAVGPRTTPAEPGTVRGAVDAARTESSGLDLESTNVERALDLAMGVFPPGFGRRVLLFSDGNATDGDAMSKVHHCRRSGVDVRTVTLSHEGAPFDLAVTSVSLPTRVQPGVGFDVTVGLSARAADDATLSLYRNGYLLEERKLSLTAGRRRETFRQRLDDPGLYLYRARLDCRQQQASLENDAAFAFTRLRTRPKVLVLGETDLEARHLMSALRGARIVCEFRTADGAPEQLPDLLDFDAVILNNLRAASLNTPGQRLLKDWVELFGGALLVVGLDAVGGYAGTPVEEALPVVSDLNRLGKVSTSVVVIADTSRSLLLADREDGDGGTPGAVLSRPTIIRRTAKQILDGLGERDTFGLIGYGSEQYAPRWVVRPQKVYDRVKIASAIDVRLQTTPRFHDLEALDALIKRETLPAAPMPPDQLAREIEALVDPHHRPHLVPKALMPLVRDRLKATKQAINPDQLCQAIERLLEPNAFLARSNAYRSVVRAVSELKQRETARKSIIMLTDGYLEGDLDYERIAGQLAADGISMSTIALKQADANKPVLEGIARWGVGRSYRLDDPAAFAERFRKGLESIGKPRVMEFPFRARKVTDSPLLRGVNVPVAPQLFGYVRTAAKLGAQHLLAVPPDYEPLLTSWEFGTGRAAVFTSDAQERWASLWVRDWLQGFNQLWSSVVHALCERPVGRRLVPQLDVDGQHLKLAVDFLDASNRFLNGESLKARFYYLGEAGYVFSRTSVEEVPMAQAAPGRYACEYRAPAKGIYMARIAGEGPRDVVATGFVVSLLAEETTLTADEATLKGWASAGGGEPGGTPETWLSVAGKTRERAVDLSQWAMIFAAVLFAGDVVLRRWPAFTGYLAARRKHA